MVLWFGEKSANRAPPSPPGLRMECRTARAKVTGAATHPGNTPAREKNYKARASRAPGAWALKPKENIPAGAVDGAYPGPDHRAPEGPAEAGPGGPAEQGPKGQTALEPTRA